MLPQGHCSGKMEGCENPSLKDRHLFQFIEQQLGFPAEKGEYAFIDVTMPESLGGLTTTLRVQVRDRGGSPNDPKIIWAPDTLNVATDQIRTVRLQLNQPAPPGGLMVELTLKVKEGPADLVTFSSPITFAEGSRVAEVEITAGPNPGNGEIEAALSDDFGGDSSDLKVQVREKKE